MKKRNLRNKHPSKPRRKRRNAPRKSATETTLGIIDRFLLSIKVPVRINGEEQKITALEAIICQLMKKQASGDNHASRVLQKYEELAPAGTEAPLQIAFVESDYTQTLAASTPEGDDG